jgi:hypothetical protein
MESWGTPKTFKIDLTGQNSMSCGVFYIIENFLELRLALLIWAFETQVMAKRRVESQIASLTPDQKKSGIDPIYLVVDNVPHTVGKLSTRPKTLLQTSPRSKVYSQSY